MDFTNTVFVKSEVTLPALFCVDENNINTMNKTYGYSVK